MVAAVTTTQGRDAPGAHPPANQIEPLSRAPKSGPGRGVQETFLPQSPQVRTFPDAGADWRQGRPGMTGSRWCRQRIVGGVGEGPSAEHSHTTPKESGAVDASGTPPLGRPSLRLPRRCESNEARGADDADGTCRRCTSIEPSLDSSPAAARSGPAIRSVVRVLRPVPNQGETVNPVRLATLHPALENPPAAAEALANRRPVDVRRVLFAAASRPSSGWGA